MLYRLKLDDSDRVQLSGGRSEMDTNAGFVFPRGPLSDLFLFWPGTLELSWDRAVVSEKAFKNYPKLEKIRLSAEYLSIADAQMYFI